MDASLTTQQALRGLARDAARKDAAAESPGLGRAYREACRAHSFVIGSYVSFADAYDEAREEVAS